MAVKITAYARVHTGVVGVHQVNVKVNVDLYSTSSRIHPKVLRYGTRSQGISQFYLHTVMSSANGINHKLPFPCQPKLVLIYQRLLSLITSKSTNGNCSFLQHKIFSQQKTKCCHPNTAHLSQYKLEHASLGDKLDINIQSQCTALH